MQPVHRHVRGRIAQIAAALVAMQHGAVDAVPMAKHAFGIQRPPPGQRNTNGGRAVFDLAVADQRRDGHAKAQLLPKIGQCLRVTGTLAAKAEIRTDGDMAHAKAAHQHLAREIPGRKPGKNRVEGQFVKVIHAQPRQPVGPRFRVHQPERRMVFRGKELARMRLEGNDAQGRIGGRTGRVDHRAVPKMHAIEIAHGDRRAAGLWRQPLPVVMDAHSPPRWAGKGPGRSNSCPAGQMRRPARFKTRIVAPVLLQGPQHAMPGGHSARAIAQRSRPMV